MEERESEATLRSVFDALASSEEALHACVLRLQHTSLAPAERAALADLCADAEKVVHEIGLLAAFRFGRGWRASADDRDDAARHALGLVLAGGEGLRALLAEVAAVANDPALERAVASWRERRAALVSQLDLLDQASAPAT